jgi:hypothetical protein
MNSTILKCSPKGEGVNPIPLIYIKTVAAIVEVTRRAGKALLPCLRSKSVKLQQRAGVIAMIMITIAISKTRINS